MVVSHTIHMYIFSYLFWAKSCNFHSVNLENRVCEKNSWNLDVAYLSLQFNYGLNFHKKFCFLTKGVEKERPNCFKIASDCTISIYYSHFWPGKARGPPPPPLRKGVSPSAPTLTALASALGLLLGVLHDTSVHTCFPHALEYSCMSFSQMFHLIRLTATLLSQDWTAKDKEAGRTPCRHWQWISRRIHLETLD